MSTMESNVIQTASEAYDVSGERGTGWYSDSLSILNRSAYILALVLAWSTSTFAQHEHHMHDDHPAPEGAEIGHVDFGVSCEEGVRADFDHALGMLHHMMYVTSRSAFEEIAEADPNCAMAYWGIATTLFQPLWGTRPSAEELERGWRKIGKARELVESDRERHLIETTEAFFREPETAEFGTRVQRWIEAMAVAYQAHPDDVDVAALYSLSRLTLASRSENRAALFDEAETILREIFEQVPTHPGAIHYSIHATDVDGRAENALDMVEAYGEIAPEVPHALHMPSHIYVRLGDWPEVIDWNRRSADAALNYPVDGSVSHHFIHAIDYLAYAYLQQGEDDKAEAVIQEAQAKDRHQASFVSAFHAAAMPARLAVEQRDWERASSLEPRTPGYLPWDASPWAEGLTWYARGLGAVRTGGHEAAEEAQNRLAELRNEAKAAGDEAMATYIETDRLILAGWIAHARGDAEEAVALMRSGVELERTVEKHPVTPGALLPPNEALGDLFMDLDRPAEALEAYQASDAIWPGRYNTLLGAARAARAAGEEKIAERLYDRLLAGARDSERTEISEARSFVAEQ